MHASTHHGQDAYGDGAPGKPKSVISEKVLEGNSFDLPRDVKQVRNLGQAIRSKEPGKALHNAGPSKNIAYDIMSIINDVPAVRTMTSSRALFCPRVSRH